MTGREATPDPEREQTPHYEPSSGPVVGRFQLAWTCSLCGARVHVKQAHTDWHARLRATAREQR